MGPRGLHFEDPGLGPSKGTRPCPTYITKPFCIPPTPVSPAPPEPNHPTVGRGNPLAQKRPNDFSATRTLWPLCAGRRFRNIKARQPRSADHPQEVLHKMPLELLVLLVLPAIAMTAPTLFTTMAVHVRRHVSSTKRADQGTAVSGTTLMPGDELLGRVGCYHTSSSGGSVCFTIPSPPSPTPKITWRLAVPRLFHEQVPGSTADR